jgi:acyl-CoA thioesterase FadM
MQLTLPRPPRIAFSAREVARPGEIWRLLQEAALEGSARCGWDAARWRSEQCAMVMRSMKVVHHRELAYGRDFTASTSVPRVRRDTFFSRDLALVDGDGPVASARQEWAVVSYGLERIRAPRALIDAFPIEPGPEVALPAAIPCAVVELPPLQLDALFASTDPLDHVNHTVYLDWCDGVVARELSRRGVAPRDLVPVAEEATFRAGIVAGDPVRVESRLVGVASAGAVAFDHRVLVGDVLAATLTTIRTLAGGAARLLDAFGVERAA